MILAFSISLSILSFFLIVLSKERRKKENETRRKVKGKKTKKREEEREEDLLASSRLASVRRSQIFFSFSFSYSLSFSLSPTSSLLQIKETKERTHMWNHDFKFMSINVHSVPIPYKYHRLYANV